MGKDAEFLDAARNGNVQLVEKVLSTRLRRSGPLASLRRGPGANVQDSSGYTALHHASLNGHRSVVALLLRHEASVNVQDHKGSTALHLAAWAGHTHVIKVLLQQGPSMPHINHQNKGGDSALHFAAQYGHTETARLLLQYGADPTLPNLKAETSLDLAAQFGRLSIAELFVKEAHQDLLRPFTADAATTAVFPHTPLHLASKNGHLSVVKLLLKYGHHVNVRTSLGSPLHEAAICGKVDVVRALMEAGADADVRNDLGHTVLDTISSTNTPVTKEISSLIRSHHALLIDIDDDQTTCGVADEGENRAASPCLSEVSASASFEFPSLNIPSLLFNSPSTPSSTSAVSIPQSQSSSSSFTRERPSSAPTNFFSSLAIHHRESVHSSHSASPPYLPAVLPPSHFGCPYENVLVPTPLPTSDGENPLRTLDRRVINHKKRDRGDARNRNYRLKIDRECGGESRLSDTGRTSDCDGQDGRASIISEFSSVYDIPQPPKPTYTSDRSSISTRSSSTHDILDDDSTYEVPPPPRLCSQTSRKTKDLSDGEYSSKPHPPPKPPRRSICPPSPTIPTDGDDESSYEMICFASSGSQEKKSSYENANVKLCVESKDVVSSSLVENRRESPIPSKARKCSSFSSDSDSDSGTHQQANRAHSNKAYTGMSFKPVKSRRTSKSPHTYENTVRQYENFHCHYKKSPNRNDDNYGRDSLSPNLQRGYTVDHHYQGRKSLPDPLTSFPLVVHHKRAKSSQSAATDGTSEDSEAERRPKSLGIMQQGNSEELLPKRASRDVETETEPEDSQPIEVQSTGVGDSHPLTDDEIGGTGLTNGEVAERDAAGSSCSLSSASASLSDRSTSTDTIEEVKSEVKFAGLFRGSRVTADAAPLMSIERPRSLTSPATSFRGSDKAGFRVSYPSMKHGSTSNSSCSFARDMRDFSKSEKGNVLSPLEEDEEWARISDIMASFGGGVTRESVFMAELEQEFQQRLGMSLSPSQQKLSILQPQNSTSSNASADRPVSPEKDAPPGKLDISSWLRAHGFPQYEATFLAHGYDDINYVNGLLDDCDLQDIGVSDSAHREILLSMITGLPMTIPAIASNQYNTLEQWLETIGLLQYSRVFLNHGFGDMERVRKIWEVELSVVLEVTRSGHRRRMLASLGDRPIEPELPASLAPQDLSLELAKLNTDISELKEKLFTELPQSTSRERHPQEDTIKRGTAKRRAAPPPPPPKAPRLQRSFDRSGALDKSVDVPLSDVLALRDPSQLVVGVPNTQLTSWKHHPTKLVDSNVQYMAQYLGSTHVKELKGTESTMKSIQKLRRSTADGAKVPRIILSVSCLGVRFIDGETQNVVCEHEIRNIHCACQDSEDLSHFAYITKDTETQGHYCHVFRVQSKDLATEIIMTLGEAFEVAYQMAIRDQLLANQSDEQKLAHGHSRSKSEHIHNPKAPFTISSHTRSLSSVSSQLPRGTTAPNTSLENLLSDSGNVSDREGAECASTSRKDCSSPSVSSTSTSGSGSQAQQQTDQPGALS